MTSSKLFRLHVAVAARLVGAALALAGCGDKPAPSTASQAHSDSESATEATRSIELTDEQVSRSGIKTGVAGPANLSDHLALYGVIAPNAEKTLDVSARYPGVIRAVKVRVGDEVKRGQALATVESNESLQTYPVTAPLDGVVTLRDANEGAQTGDKPLFTVADLTTVWVELSVFPRDIAKVRVGQTVRVRSADTGLTAEGKVVHVAPFGSSTSQTLTARVQLPNPDRQWRPGLYVNAHVVLSSSSIPLAIRSEALQTVESRTVVFVRTDTGFDLRPVETGRGDGEVSEIVSGLTVGETYATTHSFILKAELGKGEAEHGH